MSLVNRDNWWFSAKFLSHVSCIFMILLYSSISCRVISSMWQFYVSSLVMFVVGWSVSWTFSIGSNWFFLLCLFKCELDDQSDGLLFRLDCICCICMTFLHSVSSQMWVSWTGLLFPLLSLWVTTNNSTPHASNRNPPSCFVWILQNNCSANAGPRMNTWKTTYISKQFP